MSERVWMVRAGSDNVLADLVVDKGIVAIGWSKMGDLGGLHTKQDFRTRYKEAYPEASRQQVAVGAGQAYRFAREITIGDYVLTDIKASREYLIGTIEGQYQYVQEFDYPQVRPVAWIKKVSRDSFGEAARKSLVSRLTVFNLDDYLEEIISVLEGEVTEEVLEGEEIESPPYFEETEAQAKELIADLVSRIEPYQFQDLVAAVLRAMGFKAKSSPPGRDKGVDIVAYSDRFGFEKRIKAQVKHRTGKVGANDMRAFLTTLRGDNGLFVSSGDFTSEAIEEAKHHSEPVKLMDRDEFIELMLEHYPQLEPEYKALVPLRQIWVPVK